MYYIIILLVTHARTISERTLLSERKKVKMEEKSRILIIGVTGNLGFKLAEASLKSGHPTFALVRESSYSVPEKAQKLQLLANSGASLLNVRL